MLQKSVQASHQSAVRPAPNILQSYFTLDESLCDPGPKTILIFDDMITTGSHFKACKALLLERFPNAKIIGVFIARRVFKEEEE